LVDPEKMIYKTLLPKAPLHKEMEDMGTDTVAKLFDLAVKKHGTKRSLGVRDVISEEEVLDPATGKFVKKQKLGAYRWKSYAEVAATVDKLARGLNKLNLKPKEKIAIFAETREEWFMTAMAAFRRTLPSKS
jgi:long-chain acyl-CoA synthetase